MLVLVHLLLVVVIMMRSKAVMKQGNQRGFRIYSYTISTIIFLGGFSTCYFAPLVFFGYGYNYDKSPAFMPFILSAGLCVNTLLSFHMTFSAYAFLYMIYSTRGIPFKAFVWNWLMEQNGARYIILLGMTSFNIICFFYAAIFGQNGVN
jgi:hypothetical protein